MVLKTVTMAMTPQTIFIKPFFFILKLTMAGKKFKKQKEQKIFLIVAVLFSVIIAGSLIFSNWKINQKRKQLTKRVEELKAEIQRLGTSGEELQKGLSDSEKESYWEARAREFGYQKPGETVVVVKKEGEAAVEQSVSENFWQKFLGQVKGIFE